MSKKKRVPELRFKGFSDEWEEKVLGEIFESFQYGLNAAADKYDGINKYIRITDIDDESHEFKLGEITSPHTDLSLAGKYILEEGDVLFARTGASVGKTYIHDKSNGKVYFAGFLIRAKVKKCVNSNFIFLKTLTKDYIKFVKTTSQRSGQPGINANEYSNYNLLLPQYAEQSKIAQYLQYLNTIIALHRRKLEKLVQAKRAMLDKMFPGKGAVVPEVRFKGFDGVWEKMRLGDITALFTNPVFTPHDGYWRLGIRSHAKGTFHEYVKPGRELETAQMHMVGANNLIVNITFAWEHAVAITDENDAGKLVSHRFPQFSFRTGMDPKYFKFLIIDEHFRHHLWLASPGGAGRNRVLKIDQMLEYQFMVPSFAEQNKIALFFQYIDSLIALQQKELDKLKNIKKSCLAKMFA